MSTTAISSQTATANSSAIALGAGETIQVFTDLPLGDNEDVSLQRSYDSGTTWVKVIDSQYRGLVLTSRIESQSVSGPGTFRLVKSATATATAVYYDE